MVTKTTSKNVKKPAKAKSSKNLTIKLVKGVASCTDKQKSSVHTLGLHRIGQSVVRPDTPAVRGLIASVYFLLSVEEGD